MASEERNGGANVASDEDVQFNAQGKKKQKHDKPKPWDHDGIDHWQVVKIAPEDNPSGLLEESSFATLFPQYRGATTYSPPVLYSFNGVLTTLCNSLKDDSRSQTLQV